MRHLGVLLVALVLGTAPASAFAQTTLSHAVVLVTLDGARGEEVFGGLDATVLLSMLKEGAELQDEPVYRRAGAACR
jgi:hypothetical protein